MAFRPYGYGDRPMLEFVLEGVFHVLVRVVGYGILRCRYTAAEVDIESFTVAAVGLLAWVAVIGVVVLVVLV